MANENAMAGRGNGLAKQIGTGVCLARETMNKVKLCGQMTASVWISLDRLVSQVQSEKGPMPKKKKKSDPRRGETDDLIERRLVVPSSW